jgi:hypothetical protein
MRKRCILGYSVVAIAFALCHMATGPYDDAHFFKRIALHALNAGSLAWNVSEGPVYGVTSQLFQALSVLVLAVTHEYYMLATRGVALACIVAGFALSWALTRKLDGGLSSAMAFVTPVVMYPVLSGMETTLVFLLLTAFLWLLYADGAERRHFALAPGLAVLVYLARPDALLLVLPLLLYERRARSGRWPLAEFALVGGLLGLALVFFRYFYGTALPLPFYAKQAVFTPYDPHFLELSRQARNVRCSLFLAFTAPLWWLGLQRRDATNLALLGTSLAFCAYHFFFTVDVMGMHGRFYAPAVPWLAFASARGVATLAREKSQIRNALLPAAIYLGFIGLLLVIGWLPTQSAQPTERVDTVSYALLVPMLATALVVALSGRAPARFAPFILVAAFWSVCVRLSTDALHAFTDEQFLEFQTQRYTVYRGLDTLRACFGERIHIYHSEAGLPGLRFQNGIVSDLAGLLSPRWLFRAPGSFDELCTRDRPEAIFLPHKNYGALNREILRGSCIKGYRRMVAESSSPLHVRKDLVPRYRACAQAQRDFFVVP